MERIKVLCVATGNITQDDAQSIRILSLVNGLRNKQHIIKLLTFSKKLTPSFADSNEFNFVECPLFNPILITKTIKMIYKFSPDVIITHTHHPTVIIHFLKNIRLRHIPIIFDMHGLLVAERMLFMKNESLFRLFHLAFNNWVEKTAINTSHKILCVSHRVMHYLNKQMNISLEKMIYIPNGVDLNFFKPVENEIELYMLKKKLGLENKFIFGYVGSFLPWQGVENFIKAALSVKNKKLGFLIVGGKGSWVKHNIVKVKHVPRRQLPVFYSLCDVLVLPRPRCLATEVAAPTKFAEYTAMARPVMVTSVGDAAFFTKKYECGIVLPDNSLETIIRGINDFSEVSYEELQKMGHNSRKLAEQEFDLNKIIFKLNQELIKLVSPSN